MPIAEKAKTATRNSNAVCQADRLSDHRYMANLFRLYLHATAYNLLVRLRRLVADPPPESEQPRSPARRSAAMNAGNTTTTGVNATRLGRGIPVLGKHG